MATARLSHTLRGLQRCGVAGAAEGIDEGLFDPRHLQLFQFVIFCICAALGDI